MVVGGGMVKGRPLVALVHVIYGEVEPLPLAVSLTLRGHSESESHPSAGLG